MKNLFGVAFFFLVVACDEQSSVLIDRSLELPFDQYESPFVFATPLYNEFSRGLKQARSLAGSYMSVLDWKSKKVVSKTFWPGAFPIFRAVYSPATEKYYVASSGKLGELDPKTASLTVKDLGFSPLMRGPATKSGFILLEDFLNYPRDGKYYKRVHLYDTKKSQVVDHWDFDGGINTAQIGLRNIDDQDRFVFDNSLDGKEALFRLDPHKKELKTLYVHSVSASEQAILCLGVFQRKILVSIYPRGDLFHNLSPIPALF